MNGGEVMAFLQFVVKFAYLGIAVALAGLFIFLRFRKYDEDTGKSSTGPKAIAVTLFVIGAVWVISPFFIKLAAGAL